MRRCIMLLSACVLVLPTIQAQIDQTTKFLQTMVDQNWITTPTCATVLEKCLTCGGQALTCEVYNKCNGPNKELTLLDLAGCTLTGTLPPMSLLPYVTLFSVSNNQISGTVPSLTANSALSFLWLSNNNFSGTLPSFTANTALNSLEVSGNLFTSTGAPDSCPRCTTNLMDYCHLEGNPFTLIAPDYTTYPGYGTSRSGCNAQCETDGNLAAGYCGPKKPTQPTAQPTNTPPEVESLSASPTLLSPGFPTNLSIALRLTPAPTPRPDFQLSFVVGGMAVDAVARSATPDNDGSMGFTVELLLPVLAQAPPESYLPLYVFVWATEEVFARESIVAACFCGPEAPKEAVFVRGAGNTTESSVAASDVVPCGCGPGDWLYISEGCKKGTFPLYGSSGDSHCVDCSKKANWLGATCPGGNRLFPLPGWWNGDSTEFPERCFPTSACPGGAPRVCAAGYEGHLCGSCKENFFRESRATAGGTCQACPVAGDVQSILLWACLVLFVGLLLVAVLFFPNSKLDTAAVGMSNLQQAAQVLAQAAPSLPQPFCSLGPYASLITFDLLSVRPECSSLRGSLHFYSSLVAAATLLLCLLPLASVASLLRAFHGQRQRNSSRQMAFQQAKVGKEQMRRNEKAGQMAGVELADDGGEGLAGLSENLTDTPTSQFVDESGEGRTLWTLFCDRLVRAVTILLFLFYLRLTTNSLEILVCSRSHAVEGQVGPLRLALSPDTVCYSSSHTPVALGAMLVLLLLSMGYPVGAICALRRWRRLGRHDKAAAVKTERRLGFLFRGLKPAFPYFRFSSFLLLFVSALNSTVLTQLTFKLLSYLASFLLQFAYVLWKLPYKKDRENALALVVGLGKGCMVVMLLALQKDATPWLVLVTVALLIGAVTVWRKRKWMDMKLAKFGLIGHAKVEERRPEAQMALRSDADYARL